MVRQGQSGLPWSKEGRLLWQEVRPQAVVFGVDEVGRGCLAGPVVAGACYLHHEQDDAHFLDSKAITSSLRSSTSEIISQRHSFSIGMASSQEIDEINILQASFLAMFRAITELSQKINVKADLILVDGPYGIPQWNHCQQLAIVKGDQLAPPIAAASIVAKVTRDRYMVSLGKQAEFSAYGFATHKGYGTKAHRQAIAEYGLSPQHRRSFCRNLRRGK